jgi:hypothetical protein
MTEYIKVEKIVPKFPPPAFSDISKASNDVCFGPPLESFIMAQLLTWMPSSLSTRTSTTPPQV